MATNDPGTQKYWFNGLPDPGILGPNQPGTQKYWINGLVDPPMEYTSNAPAVNSNFFLLFNK